MQQQKGKVELLAPAGNMEKLKTAQKEKKEFERNVL